MTSLELPVPDPVATAEAYRRVLGFAFSDGWRGSVGGQALSLWAGAPGDLPIVRLQAEPGTPPLDLVRFGLRWLRAPAA